jgi:NAD dependent epimerase/dehydratase family enzyme
MGTGRQWFSWIHIDDLLDVVSFVLDEKTLAGPINATAPAPVRYAELMATIAATLGRPLWPVKIPAPVLRAVLGELAELFVDGQRVLPERLRALDFRFRYATIDDALAQALRRPMPVSGSLRAPQ